MTQNNLYMEDDNMRLFVDVQPLFIDELETSKNAAAASALQAAQSEANARAWKNDIIDYKTGLELFYAQASDGITNSYNSSISGLSAAKSSAISDLNTQKNSIQNSLNSSLNSAINNITTNGQIYVNQARNYAEEAQTTVDNRVSTDHLNQSKGLLTGAVSTDEDVLADIKKYARSTYCGVQTEGSTPGYLSDGVTPLDPKKFVKIGSPVITNDGIASGFSVSNYLYTNSFKPVNSHWEMITKVRFTDMTPFLQFFIGQDAEYRKPAFGLVNNKTTMYLTANGSSYDIVNGHAGNNTFSLNTDYWFKCGWNGTEYYIDYSTDGVNYTRDNTISSTTPINDNTYSLVLGTSVTYPLQGSIDSKQFSITVDGVPVFSGNRTGIDTIKSDDYTVAGTPTISTDGVASGFTTNGNEIQTGYILNFTSSFELMFKVNISVLNGFYVFLGNTIFGVDYGKQHCWLSNSSLNDIGQIDGNTTILTNTDYYLKFGYANGSYYQKSSTDGINWINENSLSSNSHINVSEVKIGGWNSANGLNGSIDLNAFKIYVDGNLVYQPCLKIPYTESKTGSKVVDSVYRDRVTDMYEQFGYAPYYTLDENNGNFTLPMGEIYGMIGKLRELIIQRTS